MTAAPAAPAAPKEPVASPVWRGYQDALCASFGTSIVSAARADLERCFAEATRSGAAVRGSVAFGIVVNEDGALIELKGNDPSLPPRLADCALSALRKAAIGSPHNTSYTALSEKDCRGRPVVARAEFPLEPTYEQTCAADCAAGRAECLAHGQTKDICAEAYVRCKRGCELSD